jgi:hypothetical protein
MLGAVRSTMPQVWQTTLLQQRHELGTASLWDAGRMPHCHNEARLRGA